MLMYDRPVIVMHDRPVIVWLIIWNDSSLILSAHVPSFNCFFFALFRHFYNKSYNLDYIDMILE